jgi:hypothetical protein
VKSSVTVVLAVVLVILAGVTAAGPYLTMRQIEKAINERDAVRLENYVDFPALRTSLKEQLRASMVKELAAEDDPFAMFGMALASALIDGMADAVLTPNGLIALISGVELEEVEMTDVSSRKVDLLRNSRWTVDSLSSVSLWVKADSDESRFVLQRYGLKWKLKNIIFPM